MIFSSERWPAPVPLRALPSSPDWVGDDTYPPEARRREMEGQVTFEALVGADGVPKACRIVVPSPYVELDDGTCDRALTMRFHPPRNEDGEAVEAAYRARLTWLISDPTIQDAKALADQVHAIVAASVDKLQNDTIAEFQKVKT